MRPTRNVDRRTFVKTGAAAAAGAASGGVGSATGAASVFTLPDVTVPIVGSDQRFPVRRVYCVGRNYLEHIRELGNDEREPPFFFAKHRDAIVPTDRRSRIPG